MTLFLDETVEIPRQLLLCEITDKLSLSSVRFSHEVHRSSVAFQFVCIVQLLCYIIIVLLHTRKFVSCAESVVSTTIYCYLECFNQTRINDSRLKNSRASYDSFFFSNHLECPFHKPFKRVQHRDCPLVDKRESTAPECQPS